MAMQNMDWRSPREGGMDMPMSPLFACIKHPRSAYTDHKASSPGEVTLLDWLERVFSILSIPLSKLHRPLIASSAAFLNGTVHNKAPFYKDPRQSTRHCLDRGCVPTTAFKALPTPPARTDGRRRNSFANCPSVDFPRARSRSPVRIFRRRRSAVRKAQSPKGVVVS
ncbi:hypothetical protein HPB51_026926 [Rhipicephalus microplus]|uniref:Uncharacterized protein n=1 Tax=Rhipicephalus microplus TaxID=6941 RepID=A0A9J6D1M6_RHIMP|nr:hypothetical protein HPB51_026926 [Rhipicephalus microplus]